MKCSEILELDELKKLVSIGTWSDSALTILLDGASDFIFSLLGHSFGRAIRIYHDESEDATAATVQVTAAAIVLVITGGANAGTYTYNFSTYDEMMAVVDAINQEDVGFEATLVEGMSPTEKTANLHTLDATSCLGLSNRQILCIGYTTETIDGLNEPYIFTKLPIRAVASVLQDGSDVTSYWTKQQGWLIYKYCDGSQYQKYTVDLWSVATPCNIVVKYEPLWLRIPGFLKLILKAMVQNTMNSTGMKSEGIGDYNYVLGDIESIIAPWWPMMAQYMVGWQP